MGTDKYIWLDGEKIYVSEEVYRAYYRPVWREIKRKKSRGYSECSLDALQDGGYEAASADALIDEIVVDKLLLDELLAALAELTEDEQYLMNALYYQEKSERDVAAEIGLSQKAVNKRRHRILDKLRDQMGVEKNFDFQVLKSTPGFL